MSTSERSNAVSDGLIHLRDELAGLELGLDLSGAEEARRARNELVAQIDDYLLPRLRQMDAPLLMVVGGSTGAGKSTLVNSLVGSEVSPAGVLRPTTRAPVLVCNPEDMAWFQDDRILPGLPRTTGGAAAPGGIQLVAIDALPAGLALLDSPDIDSVVEENRALASQLLAAADSWLFVTTAARYADAVPWELLHAARDRGTAISLVLNRVPPEAAEEVSSHLREMLAARGLAGTELLVVPEATLADGFVPPAALAGVRAWLDGLAADAHARAALVRRTLTGALDSLSPRVQAVERTIRDQLATIGELRAAVETSYAAGLAEVDETVRSGSLLRGEVLSRWHEVVGTGDVMRALESRIGWLRDRLRALITGTPAADAELEAAVETRIDSVVHAAADRAAELAANRWRQEPSGRRLLERSARLDAASPRLLAAIGGEVRAWQGFVFELVREEGADKRTTARLASLGVNGAGLTVMLAVFVQTGGLTGAEIAVAGGTSALSQKVLEAIFGDQAVRALADRARGDLLARVERLLDAEAERFTDLLAPVSPSKESPDRLRAALQTLARAR
ncbi:MAG: GTPase domain-containing protein [Actinobacteria bacterium]|nr:GTPase domain-containing protein [Actinomycetota bacterium]